MMSMYAGTGVEFVPMESRFLAFRGLRVHFTVVRPEGEIRQRLMALSSPLISAFHWRKLLPEFDGLGCLTVLCDLPGFGQSDCATAVPVNLDLQAHMLWGILDAVDEDLAAPLSTWHLMAHGLACRTALKMAGQYPDSVRSQVHLCPVYAFEQPRRGYASVEKQYARAVESRERFRPVAERLAGYPLDDYILDRMRQPLARPGARENFLRILKSSAAPPDQPVTMCPSMLVWGGRDALSGEGMLPTARALLPGVEVHRLKSSGHFPMETHSRALRDYLRGWMRFVE